MEWIEFGGRRPGGAVEPLTQGSGFAESPMTTDPWGWSRPTRCSPSPRLPNTTRRWRVPGGAARCSFRASLWESDGGVLAVREKALETTLLS